MQKVLWSIGALVAIGIAAIWWIRSRLTPETVLKAYAKDAVDTAQRSFQVTLDYSEESIRQLEGILSNQHVARQEGQEFSEKEIGHFCTMWGAYLGEVIRREHGGEWSIPREGVFQGHYVLTVDDTQTSPTAKVWKRLTDGDGDNVYMYYRVLASKFAMTRSGASQEQ